MTLQDDIKKQEINNFLNLRHERARLIEISAKLYRKIGERLFGIKREIFGNDVYIDGCMYSFFSFMQQVLLHFIYNNFQSIIGSYDTKNDSLKSWESFNLDLERILILKSIRARYADIRNNYTAHISDNFKITENYNVYIDQVEKDICSIRKIFNSIRKRNNIAEVIQGYDSNDDYAVQGIQEIFDQLLIEQKTQEKLDYFDIQKEST